MIIKNFFEQIFIYIFLLIIYFCLKRFTNNLSLIDTEDVANWQKVDCCC